MVLLTEHMLFYASEKYPGEHEYTKYITEVHSIHQFQSKCVCVGVRGGGEGIHSHFILPKKFTL